MNETNPSAPTASRFLAWVSAELFFIFGVIVAIFFGILSPDVSTELRLNASQLGLLSGVFFITYSIGQIVLGSLLGPWSPRLLLGSMAIVSAIGCVLFAASTSMPVALFARALLGVGLSISFVGVMHVISRDYPQRFSFMASLSQSLANIVGALMALAAGFTTVLSTFRGPFTVVGILFVPIAIALLIFIGRKSAGTPSQAEAAPKASVGAILAACFGSLQFWAGLVYYSCLFGTVLAYSDLWNIQFQLNFFKHSQQLSALSNAVLPLGVTFGSLAAGAWAQVRGDYVLPARVFGLLAVAAFGVMYTVFLPEWMALSANFCIGFALAGSILGFTAIQRHLPEYAQATGTALVATAAFVLGGIVQPAIGLVLEVPLHSTQLFQLIMSDDPNFGHYQKGMMLLFLSVLAGFLASLLFKGAPAAPAPGREA